MFVLTLAQGHPNTGHDHYDQNEVENSHELHDKLVQ
jgi:hypothetical protein